MSGEEQTLQGTCHKCEPGFYLIDPPTSAQSCKQCDYNAICYGENILAPRPGYYRSSPTSDQILECYNPESCIGGNQTNVQGLCAPGYTGFMCGGCELNRVKFNWETCTECPSYNTTLIWVSMRVALITVVILLICKLQT